MPLGPGVASSDFSCPSKGGWSRTFGINWPLTIGVSRKIPFGYPLSSKRVCIMFSRALVCNDIKQACSFNLEIYGMKSDNLEL